MERKREQMRRSVIGNDAKIARYGFIDTTKGAVLTSDRALELARNTFQAEEAKKLADQVKA